MSNQQKQNDEFQKRLFFNKYRPDKKLGEGSFGKIYSAINISNNQKIALKMVKTKIILKYKILLIYRN